MKRQVLGARVVVMLGILLLSGPVWGRDWFVDDNGVLDPGPGNPLISDPDEDGSAIHPFDSIQEAIVAARGRDTIWVKEGTYRGVGNFNISFMGKGLTLISESGAEHCIIDCEASVSNWKRGFHFFSGEEPNAVLDGFSVINGYEFLGGGILVDGCNPTIRHCVLENNKAQNAGGGICYQFNTWALLSDCNISNNRANYGGGIKCIDSELEVQSCIIEGNIGYLEGGGIRCSSSTVHLEKCKICDNGKGKGGGIYINNGCYVSLSNCILSGNQGTYGGALHAYLSEFALSNCTLAKNTAYYGRAVACSSTDSMVGSHIKIFNSIIWDEGIEIHNPGGSTFSINYSDMYGGYAGVGNIAEDPGFTAPADDNFHLELGSPCIDAGTNDPPWGIAETDFDGNPRMGNGDDDGLIVVDMGVYEFWRDQPNIVYTHARIDFLGLQDGSNPASQVFFIQNGGTGELNWQVNKATSIPWLSVNPANGSSAGEWDMVTLSVDISGLALGEYLGELTIWDPCALNNPQGLEVSLRVWGPEIDLSSSTISFVGMKGEPNPADQVFTIGNSKGGVLNWTIDPNYPDEWLTVLPKSGDVPLGGAPDDVTVQVDLNNLRRGYHSCRLVVSDPNAENHPQAATVGVQVWGPVIEVSKDQFRFAAIKDGANPAVGIMTMANVGEGKLIWTAEESCDWLSVEPTAGVLVDEPNEMRVLVDISGMDYGLHECVLHIVDSQAYNSPYVIEVYLWITVEDNILWVPHEQETIQAAINVAEANDVVMVVSGTWRGIGNRDIDFLGKAITVRSEEGPEHCIIDCEGGSSTSHRGFKFHNHEGSDSVVEGFTIINGYTQEGGAFYFDMSSPTIRNCYLWDNNASNYGGAIRCRYSHPTFIDCIINGNKADYGGGIYGTYSDTKFIRCLICANEAESKGGAIRNYGCDSRILSCTISGNRSNFGGGGIYNQSGGTEIHNSIVWGNTPDDLYDDETTMVITFSNIGGGWVGTGNIDADPCFADVKARDYHLQSQVGRWDSSNQVWVSDPNTSPCIDGGDPTADWSAELWPEGERMNMGAFGGTAEASMSLNSVGNGCDLNRDGVVDLKDWCMFCDQWLVEEVFLATDFDRSGLVDQRDVSIFVNYWLWRR